MILLPGYIDLIFNWRF